MKSSVSLASLKSLGDRIDALNLRERALVFAGVLGVLLVFATNYLFPSLQSQQKQLESELKVKRDQARVLYAQTEGLAKTAQRDTEAEQRARIAELKAKLHGLEGPAAPGAQQVVTPRETVRLVRELLTRNRSLQLVRLENLPATALVPAAGADAPAPAAGQIYRHGLRVQVRGQYRDIARYLQALEALPWRVYWGEVHLETQVYPHSELTVVIYTLSPNSEWIGT